VVPGIGAPATHFAGLQLPCLLRTRRALRYKIRVTQRSFSIVPWTVSTMRYSICDSLMFRLKNPTFVPQSCHQVRRQRSPRRVAPLTGSSHNKVGIMLAYGNRKIFAFRIVRKAWHIPVSQECSRAGKRRWPPAPRCTPRTACARVLSKLEFPTTQVCTFPIIQSLLLI